MFRRFIEQAQSAVWHRKLRRKLIALAFFGRYTSQFSLSPQPPREKINENRLPPLPPATMLIMTIRCRTRFVLLVLIAHDLAHRRNIVAGGRGEGDSRLFFPSRGLEAERLSRRRHREAASIMLPLLQLILSCGPKMSRKRFLCGGHRAWDSRLFFPSGASPWDEQALSQKI